MNRKTVSLIGLVLILCLTSSAITYAVTVTFSFSTVIEGGSMVGPYSYVVGVDGSTYYAKNGITGAIDYSGSNFTTLSVSCISTLPSNGGKIWIKAGAYIGHIVIDRSNVILEGEGGPGDIPVSSDPGKSPSALIGTVITPEEGQNGIYISGANRTGIQVRNLGIWFKTASTGHGITTDKDQQFHLRDAVFENIAVLAVDETHYGLSLCNFLFVTVHSFRTYGGCILEIYGNLPYFQQGNSVFDDLYNEVTETLNVDFANGPYPVFIHPNDTITGYPWYQSGANLLTMRRIQVNTPTAQSDSDFYQTCFFALKISTIEGLDLEGVTSANKTVQMGSCQNVEFLNAYMWAQNTNCSLNIASNNMYITWVNPFINGQILDSNETDSWINPYITGDIVTDSRANFVNLNGNSGNDTLTSGQTSVTISAKFIGPNNYVLLTIIDADAIASGEALKVSTINIAPANTFLVECIDEGTASVSITFYWQICHVP